MSNLDALDKCSVKLSPVTWAGFQIYCSLGSVLVCPTNV